MRQRQSGFTIVELMIATLVFSIVLLIITAALVQVGRLYYKGLTESRTQNVARTIMADITQAIQFNNGVPVPSNIDNGSLLTTLNNPAGPTTFTTNRAICLTTIHYSFRFGQQRVGNAHALVRNVLPAGCSSTIAQNMSGTVSGNEMLGENMRLSNLVVKPLAGNPRAYQVIVRVVYGDNDLLCSPNLAANCDNTLALSAQQLGEARDLRCKNIRSGSEFCAVSELSTIVERRL